MALSMSALVRPVIQVARMPRSIATPSLCVKSLATLVARSCVACVACRDPAPAAPPGDAPRARVHAARPTRLHPHGCGTRGLAIGSDPCDRLPRATPTRGDLPRGVASSASTTSHPAPPLRRAHRAHRAQPRRQHHLVPRVARQRAARPLQAAAALRGGQLPRRARGLPHVPAAGPRAPHAARVRARSCRGRQLQGIADASGDTGLLPAGDDRAPRARRARARRDAALGARALEPVPGVEPTPQLLDASRPLPPSQTSASRPSSRPAALRLPQRQRRPLERRQHPPPPRRHRERPRARCSSWTTARRSAPSTAASALARSDQAAAARVTCSASRTSLLRALRGSPRVAARGDGGRPAGALPERAADHRGARPPRPHRAAHRGAQRGGRPLRLPLTRASRDAFGQESAPKSSLPCASWPPSPALPPPRGKGGEPLAERWSMRREKRGDACTS
jgi:hypothetical protein